MKKTYTPLIKLKDGSTALHTAASTGNTEIVQLLIDNGIKINFQNKDGSTALHSAASTGNTEIVQLLIDNGIEINFQNKVRNTALHLAAGRNNDGIATLLLNRGCNPNLKNKDVSTSTRVCCIITNPVIAVKENKHALLLSQKTFLQFTIPKVPRQKHTRYSRSGFIDLVEKEDHVMADRGFLIKDLLLSKGATINVPPFTRPCKHGKGRCLATKEIKESKFIETTCRKINPETEIL
ncbi:unnamed protein product [Mytilus edulis]|uniref:Uncharacterized protein n=1 Tax=Mytilus edulis TaxID=6550 RepID=A0A8S3VRX7_MYTED|nr:unnamed protein product [Mytilus edulis]